MMNKNINSPTKLTEFAPLSPEVSQPVVASLFSKFFGFGKSKCALVFLPFYLIFMYLKWQISYAIDIYATSFLSATFNISR